MNGIEQIKNKIKGVFAFPITPFRKSSSSIWKTEIDEEGIRKNARFIAEHKLHGVVPCGGTGEFYSLSLEEYKSVVEITYQEIGNKSFVVPMVGHNMNMAVKMSQCASEIGCSAVVVFPPTMSGGFPEEGLLHYYKKVAENVGMGIIPFITSACSLDFFQKLMEVENIIAIKDGVSDLKWFRKVIQLVKGRFSWLAENEMNSPYYYLYGAHGVTSGIADFLPKLSISLYNAAIKGDYTRAKQIQQKLELVSDLRSRHGHHIPVVKAAMDTIGLSGGEVRPPLVPLSSSEKEELTHILNELGVLS
jgi:4-hydroxy-tetrahydrodipicolinate synthase